MVKSPAVKQASLPDGRVGVYRKPVMSWPGVAELVERVTGWKGER
jgi:hypothetical protein